MSNGGNSQPLAALGQPLGTSVQSGAETKREGRDPEAKAPDVPAFEVARGKGFEPLAFGSGVGLTERAGDGNGSQPLAIPRDASGRTRPTWSGLAAPFARLGTPVVQRGRGLAGPDARFVSVGELARMLGVSRATVYRAVGSGQIPHVRVSNAIRIPLAVR
jgi:excisionase family DNA binding protein